MKTKTLLVVLVAFLAALTCSARDRVSHNVDDLPAAAKTFITTHFPSAQVSHIKIDSHFTGGNDYDVVLTDGTEIDFDSRGNLEDIDCGRNGQVPDAIVPQRIRDYVSNTYPGQKIIKYDVKRKGYEVELRSGLEIEFDANGNFKRVDR